MMLRRALPALAVALVACGGAGDGPSTTQASASGAQQPAPASTLIKPSSLTWTAPAPFTLVAHPSGMRLATYTVAKAEGDPEDAEMTVTQVGGGVEKNVERWVAQFDGVSEREKTETTVGDLKVTVIWLEGTYKGMSMPGAPPNTPKGDQALLGAIVSGATGDEHYFKLTGPKKTIESARPAFDELVQSFAKRG